MKKSIMHLSLALLVAGCPLAVAAGNPASVEAALRDLHRNVALGARWAAFGPGSTVRARVRTVSATGEESTYVRLQELTRRDQGKIITTYWDADHKEEIGPMAYDLDAPDLTGAKARHLAADTVLIGSQSHPAEVYQFEKSFRVLSETRLIRWSFWLAAGFPAGELRRITESESTDPTYGSSISLSKLTDLKVPFVVGTETLECYCVLVEEKYKNGRIERMQGCFNDRVPGGIVRKTVQIFESGKETMRQDYVLIDYHAEQP